MKKTNNYNGFKSENDYQFVLNIVKSVVDNNTKINSYAVSMDEKHNIIIILNDVRITEEGLDDITFAYPKPVTDDSNLSIPLPSEYVFEINVEPKSLPLYGITISPSVEVYQISLSGCITVSA